MRSKDIKPFTPQNPKELKKTHGMEKPSKMGAMSKAKLTQRNMKAQHSQFFPQEQQADG